MISNIDIKVVDDYVKRGLLIKKKHPIYDIYVLCYTRSVVYDNNWDNVTTICRGIVVDKEGNILARPFKKFFYLKDEYFDNFEVFEKMDGSLIVSFYYNGEWIFATKGSFNSEMVDKSYLIKDKYNFDILNKNNTYLFEIIYKENKIIVDYGDKCSLILLASFNTKDGNEIPYNKLKNLNGFELVEKYDNILSLDKIKEFIKENHEGFVVRDKDGTRFKVKSDNYLLLHKLRSNLSLKNVLESIFNGSYKDYINGLPDEFDYDVKNFTITIANSINKILLSVFLNFSNTLEITGSENILYLLSDKKLRKNFYENCEYFEYHSLTLLLKKMIVENKNFLESLKKYIVKDVKNIS